MVMGGSRRWDSPRWAGEGGRGVGGGPAARRPCLAKIQGLPVGVRSPGTHPTPKLASSSGCAPPSDQEKEKGRSLNLSARSFKICT